MSTQKTIVCKFGGSSVADAGQFQKIKSILDENTARRVVIVSAPGKRTPEETKLTDLFYAVYELSVKKLDFSQPFTLIRERFLEIAKDLGLKTDVGTDLDEIENNLKNNPEQITVDYVVSRGEYLNARLMSEYLGWEFADSFDLIKIDSHHRVVEGGYDFIAEQLKGVQNVVIPGFYAQNQRGRLETFSRGGSDISGAILANALNADMYENWTDVSGLLMADPRIVEGPAPMDYVSYREIRELSYSGASVLHDEAIAPCKSKNIPINIRNTNDTSAEGTIIGPKPEKIKGVVTGIAGRKNFSMIYIEKGMMNKERGFGRKVLSILEAYNVSWEHSPTGIDSMSIIVDQEGLESCKEDVLEEIRLQMHPDKIKVFDDIALVATVGHGMAHNIGVAARLFTALANAKINVRIIDQGSSELNIITGVDHDNYQKAVEVIYKEFAEV